MCATQIYQQLYSPYTFEEIVLPATISINGVIHTLVEITNMSLAENKNLKSVTIPPTIRYIAPDAFLDDDNLASVHITDLSAWCNIEFGNENSNPAANGRLYLNGTEVTEVGIPTEITTIKNYAFYRCLSPVNLKFNDNLKSMGENCFAGCINLSTADLTSAIDTIGFSSFAGCSNLATVVLPSSLRTIDSYAFFNCMRLESVSGTESLQTIGRLSFAGCVSLKRAILPESLTKIEYGAFQACRSITDAVIPTSVEKLGTYVFANCSSLKNVSVPEKLKSLPSGTFYNCSSLSDIALPESITELGKEAFYNCTSLSSVELPEYLNCLGEGAFSNCRKLEGIVLPDSLSTLGNEAFMGCESLSSVTLGKTLRAIGNTQFALCTNIRNINARGILPPEISEEAFAGIYDNAALTVPAESSKEYIMTPWNKFFDIRDDKGGDLSPVSDGTLFYRLFPGTTETENMAFVTFGKYDDNTSSNVMIPARFTITNGENHIRYNVEGIAYKAFYGKSSLQKLEFNNRSKAKIIGPLAFGDCPKLNTISLGDSITEIRDSAFVCKAVITTDLISLPKAIKLLGKDVFAKRKFKKVNICDIANWCDVRFGSDGSNPLMKADSLLIGGIAADSLFIPNGVRHINTKVFGNISFSSVRIPGSVNEINDRGFGGKIGTLILEYSPIKLTTGSRPFGEIATLDYDRDFAASAIYNSSKSMSRIKVGNNITEIEDRFYNYFENLSEIKFGGNIRSIGRQSFYKCKSLEEVIFPPSLNTIGDNAFEYSGVKKIVMGANVTTIGRDIQKISN